MRRLIWDFAGCTYYIVGNPMPRLSIDVSIFFHNFQVFSPTRYRQTAASVLHCIKNLQRHTANQTPVRALLRKPSSLTLAQGLLRHTVTLTPAQVLPRKSTALTKAQALLRHTITLTPAQVLVRQTTTLTLVQGLLRVTNLTPALVLLMKLNTLTLAQGLLRHTTTFVLYVRRAFVLKATWIDTR